MQIDRELKVHTQIEEEIFYPAYREASRKKDDQKLYYEALEEHHVVDLVLPEMNDGENNEELKAKAKVLKELVEHHAGEEEKEMFPRAKSSSARKSSAPRRADAATQRDSDEERVRESRPHPSPLPHSRGRGTDFRKRDRRAIWPCSVPSPA